MTIGYSGGGSYESWVSRVRQWGDNPVTSLDGLPSLSEESFTPNTWQRLIKHIEAAMKKVMEQWDASLAAAIESASNDHELGCALVKSRAVLYRRVQLAKHPGLPEKVREALAKAVVSDINNIQKQLEKSMQQSSGRTVSDLSFLDSRLALIRDNPFTVVLQDGYQDSATAISTVDEIEKKYQAELAAAVAEPDVSDGRKSWLKRGIGSLFN